MIDLFCMSNCANFPHFICCFLRLEMPFRCLFAILPNPFGHAPDHLWRRHIAINIFGTWKHHVQTITYWLFKTHGSSHNARSRAFCMSNCANFSHHIRRFLRLETPFRHLLRSYLTPFNTRTHLIICGDVRQAERSRRRARFNCLSLGHPAK